MNSCRVAALVFSIVLFSDIYAAMAEVVCPVCGETLDDDVKICPNDGTDLTLVGRTRPETENDDKNNDEPKEASDETKSDKGQKRKETLIRYKRHDEGGERHIAPPKEKSDFTDRESRLLRSDRIPPTTRQKRKRMQRAKAAPRRHENKKLIEQFEKKRRYSWEKRENARLLASMGKGDKKATRQKLLATLAAPITSLGGRLFWIKDTGEPGPVGATEIDVNIIRYRLRAGFSTLLGIHSMPGPDDFVFLESLTVGLQWPNRFSPYVILKGGLGTLLSNDGKSTNATLLGSIGVDVGLDVWVNPWLAVTPSIGYMGTIQSGKYKNTFTAKIAIGF